MSVAFQARVRQTFRAPELLIESVSLGGICLILLAIGKNRIVFIELRLQHTQTMKLGEQDSSGLAGRAHRIVRIDLLPGFEIPLCASKIQIVETQKAIIQLYGGNISNCWQRDCQNRADHKE